MLISSLVVPLPLFCHHEEELVDVLELVDHQADSYLAKRKDGSEDWIRLPEKHALVKAY